MDKEGIIKLIEAKFSFSTLNEMQQHVVERWEKCKRNIVLYSPTGSGKTIAFAISILGDIDENDSRLQSAIIVPTRELAIQTTDVLKKLAPTLKITCCYGGHNSQDERRSLSQNPIIIVATPGRLLDHIERGNINVQAVTALVLDEFDKSLELGFLEEMRHIIGRFPSTVRTIMTSATIIKRAPDFIDFRHFEIIDYMQSVTSSPQSRIHNWLVKCHDNNRICCLEKLLMSLPNERTLIFSNQRETAQLISNQLSRAGIATGLFIGTLEQTDREKTLAMFANGSLMVLSATDLASRGLDISDIRHIIHYDLPLTADIFTHRNGRTARVQETGDAYFMCGKGDTCAPFINIDYQYNLNASFLNDSKRPLAATLFISAGKKEKISKGDVVGYLINNSNSITHEEIGMIHIFDHYSLVALPPSKIVDIIKTISPFKLKKQKVKLRWLQK